MIDFFQARRRLLAAIEPLAATEELPPADAAGRLLARPVTAAGDLPPWDNSAMDGFAVTATDGAQAGLRLPVSGYLPAGAAATAPLQPGTTVRIMTGAPVPAGTGAVVPLEQVRDEGEAIVIQRPVAAGEHIRRRGGDVAAGAELLAAGTPLRPGALALLIADGQAAVTVRRRPRVALCATGDELVPAGAAAGPGQLVDCNSPALAAAVRGAGGDPLSLGIAPDTAEGTLALLRRGLAADALITSAGVSVGDRDRVHEALAALGAETLFAGVAVQPGKPFTFARCGATPIFCLPGNPVSALTLFEALVHPALRRLAGRRACFPLPLSTRLGAPLRKQAGRLQLARVRLERDGEGWRAWPDASQASGRLALLARADGLALLAAEREAFAAGETVMVLPLDGCGWSEVE